MEQKNLTVYVYARGEQILYIYIRQLLNMRWLICETRGQEKRKNIKLTVNFRMNTKGVYIYPMCMCTHAVGWLMRMSMHVTGWWRVHMCKVSTLMSELVGNLESSN